MENKIQQSINKELDTIDLDVKKLTDCQIYCDGPCKNDLDVKTDIWSKTHKDHENKLVVELFCNKCFETLDEYIDDNFKLINNTNKSVEEKPLIWPCMFCSKNQGGGCKWYFYEKDNRDICMKCYNKKNFKQYFTKLDDIDSSYFLTRSALENPSYIYIKPINKYIIPKELKDEVVDINVLSEVNDIAEADPGMNITEWAATSIQKLYIPLHLFHSFNFYLYLFYFIH